MFYEKEVPSRIEKQHVPGVPYHFSETDLTHRLEWHRGLWTVSKIFFT